MTQTSRSTATHRRAPLGKTMPEVGSAALAVSCPLCTARPGKPCHDAVRGWVRAVGPHLSRIAAAVDPEGASRREAGR